MLPRNSWWPHSPFRLLVGWRATGPPGGSSRTVEKFLGKEPVVRRICFTAGRSAEVGQAPDPAPGPGQLLVRVEAVGAGVGLVRRLAAAGDRGAVVRPGGEVVGTVLALDPEVAGFAVGDR